MLSTIGDIDASAASESLTAVLNGFQMQADQAMNVVDTLNALDLKKFK